MDEDLELLKVAAGLETVQLGSIGVYHYRLSDSARNVSTCSIVSKPGPRVGGGLGVKVKVKEKMKVKVKEQILLCRIDKIGKVMDR